DRHRIGSPQRRADRRRDDDRRGEPGHAGHAHSRGRPGARLALQGEAPAERCGEAATARERGPLRPARAGAPLMAAALPLDKMAVLRASHLLGEFTDVGLRILADTSTQRSVGRGTLAFRAGDASDALAFLA